MSELKVYHCNEWHNEYTEFYMKSEADKVIEELNRKIKLYEDLGSCKKGCLALRHNQRRVESEIYRVKLKEKEILHHKYKRCLAMTMWCKSKSEIYNEFAADASEYMPSYEAQFHSKAVLYQKWAMRWLELAEQFKEVK